MKWLQKLSMSRNNLTSADYSDIMLDISITFSGPELISSEGLCHEKIKLAAAKICFLGLIFIPFTSMCVNASSRHLSCSCIVLSKMIISTLIFLAPFLFTFEKT